MTHGPVGKNTPVGRARRLERIYPLILCFCRVVLAITQFIVAHDTCLSFKNLSRLKGEVLDTPLSSIADTVINYDWVPVMDTSDSISSFYGRNKLFNYFIIRVLHLLHAQVTDFIFYPSLVTMVSMLLLSLYDVFEIYQERFSKVKVHTIGFWFHLSLYVFTMMFVILQGVILLFENGQISHMEVLYPFLFAYGNMEKTAHVMLLRTGARSLKRRLLASVLFNLASLVPDTYLFLVRTLQPLRLFVIVNALKMGCGMTIMAAFVMGFIVRYYVGSALDPKLLGDRTTLNILKHNPLFNVNDRYPRTKWDLNSDIKNSAYIDDSYKYQPVFDIPNTITCRINRTVKNLGITKVPLGAIPKFFEPIDVNKPETNPLTVQKGLAVYAFVQNSYSHALLILNVFLSVSGFIGLCIVSLSVFSFFLVLKRHKLLLYINVIVDAMAFVLHLCNIVMAMYSTQGADFFCNIKEHIPASSGTSFEAMAIYAWMCRSKELFNLVLGVTAVVVLLCIGNIGVLYVLWK